MRGGNANVGNGGSGQLVSIGVVDPVPLFRDGVCALVERTPWARLAAHSASRQGALRMAEQVCPELVVLDSGLDPQCELVRCLSGGSARSRVIVLVRADEGAASYVSSAMASGALAAVPRNAEAHRVLAAIRHAHRRQRYIDPMLTASPVEPCDAPAQVRGSQVANSPLSRREYQVLRLIAEGLENAAIGKRLYLSVETVRTHVKGILRKLSARDRTHAVAIAFRTGLLPLSPDPEPTAAPPPGSAA